MGESGSFFVGVEVHRTMIVRETLLDNKNELKSILCQLIDMVEEQKHLIANQNECIESLFLKNEE